MPDDSPLDLATLTSVELDELTMDQLDTMLLDPPPHTEVGWMPDFSLAYKFIPGREHVSIIHRTDDYGADGFDALLFGTQAGKNYDAAYFAGHSAGGLDREQIADAKRVVSNVDEQDISDAAYQSDYLGFYLPYVQVTAEPTPGDLIVTYELEAFIVLSVGAPKFQSVWRCSCKRLRLQDLGHTVTIKLPVDSTDAYASPLNTPTTTAPLTDLPCAIQQMAGDPVAFQGMKGTRHTYALWTFVQIDVPMGSVITDENDVSYRVVATANKKRVDELLKIICVIDP